MILRIYSVLFKFLYLLPVLLITASSCKRTDSGVTKPLFTSLSASRTNADFVNHLDYDKQLKSKFNIYTYRNFYNGGGVALGDVNNDGLIDIFMSSNMGKNTLYLNKGDFNFEDISGTAGIEGKGQWSTGVSIADVNGDGWNDIYVCNSGNIEGDDRKNELYINNGDLTFTEKANEYGLDDGGYSTHGLFFDYDKDGDLDMYLLNNSSKAIGSFNMKDNMRMKRDSIGGDKLFRNDNNRFTDVSEKAGIFGSVIGFGLGVTVGDVDQDGWMDIYVSNDFFERDYLYLNQHDGTFIEHLITSMRSISAASMGADMADINNDHYPEIFATDMVPEGNERLKTKTTFDNWNGYISAVKNDYHHQFTRNMLQLNNADGTFSEIGRLTGVNATDWSWGALIMDLDNDGLKDLFVANGIYKDLTDQDYIQYFSNRDMVMTIVTGNNVDYKTLIDAIPSVKIPSYAFKNHGNLVFENVASQWGLAEPSFSNGSAYGDLDNDGDLDLVVNNVNMPMFIYRNETDSRYPGNHFLKIILKGEGNNTAAIGSKITVRDKGETIYIEQMPMRGYLSTSDPRPNLGLGQRTSVDSLIIEWPDGRYTVLADVLTNQTLTLYQKDSKELMVSVTDSFRTYNRYFRDITVRDLISFTHKEDDFNDFERESLIYHMLSTEGPGMCSGDVNGDGLDDIFIGGAKDQAGSLMIQSKSGKFIPSQQELFNIDKTAEDVDCEMFDADSDGDLDLYVASGGNELPESSSALSDRLYLNDGKGYFKKSDQILPAGRYENSACVKSCDYDNDGIVELFVGIRLKPFLYGVPVSGYILKNDGKGNFSDVTRQVAPDLLNTGMIRDMEWIDVDNDNDKDIIIAGEWMPVKILINNNGIFSWKKDAFGSLLTDGWWNCIVTADFNNDGFADFLAGNHGKNSRFKASSDKPVSMYINDFDLNGNIEQVICTFNGDTSYPLALKHDLTKQIPSLERKYPKYVLYKNQQINDIFSPEQLKNAVHLESHLLETSLFLNDGKGNFSLSALPLETQFSPVFSAITGDYNHDGITDILLGGNLYKTKPEVGRYDASYGTFLAGDGKGSFRYCPAKESGLKLEGEVREILEVTTRNGKILVVAVSDGPVQVFEIRER